MARIECLSSRPVPDGHLIKFMQQVEGTQNFQGVGLRGSLEGKAKRGKSLSGSLQSEITTALNLCMKGLRERFGIFLETTECQPSTAPAEYSPKQVIRDMLVFHVDSWPTHPNDLIDFGRDEIQRLTKWFEPVLERSGCNIGEIQGQWVSMKILINGQFSKVDYASLWETFLTKVPYLDNLKDVIHLVEIVLVLPISAAQCERAVSAQNRIKSSVRAAISVPVLEDLIRLSSEGPPVADFDPTPAVNQWFRRNKLKKKQQRRPHFLNKNSS